MYEQRRITRDCLVSYRGSRYSVPHRYAERDATIRNTEDGAFEVMVDGQAIIRHKLSPTKGATVLIASHYRGIPGAATNRPPKPPLLVGAPVLPVETRPLSVYEALVGA